MTLGIESHDDLLPYFSDDFQKYVVQSFVLEFLGGWEFSCLTRSFRGLAPKGSNIC